MANILSRRISGRCGRDCARPEALGQSVWQMLQVVVLEWGDTRSRGFGLIVATALELGFDVLTANARDFEKIPRLTVKSAKLRRTV